MESSSEYTEWSGGPSSSSAEPGGSSSTGMFLCAPALIFVFFSIAHVILDWYNGDTQMAYVKIILLIFFTILLQLLCQMGLSIVAWIIVFVPFVLMTVISTFLLYALGKGFTPLTSSSNPSSCRRN
jgi:O-antigen ligase